MDKTTIELTVEEALLFVTFQKHHALVAFLESINAFDLKSGSVTIHFDAIGRISTAEKVQHYRVPV